MTPLRAYNLFWWVIASVAVGYAEWRGLKSPTDVLPTGTDLLRLLPDWLLAMLIAAAILHFRVATTLVLRALELLTGGATW